MKILAAASSRYCTVLLIIIFMLSSCNKSDEYHEPTATNTPPIAAFTFSPDSGDIQTTFHFDASTSSDIEDITAVLLVRWDWQNDGIWDTDWSTDKELNHIFDQEGSYDVSLEVKDTGALGDATENNVEVSDTGISDVCSGITTITYGGQIYNTVEIGLQCWLKENLNIGIMVDGDVEQQNNSIIEKYCYDNNTSNCDEYGGLYQWDEMMQYITGEGAQGICPQGWHIPSDDDWKVLEGTVDSMYDFDDPVWNNMSYRGFDAGKNLKSTNGWFENGNGTDVFGFTSRPGGFRQNNHIFSNLSMRALFASSSEINSENAWIRYIIHDNDGVNRNDGNKLHGFSVRCLMD